MQADLNLPSAKLVFRVGLLAIVTVIVQIGAVSQLPVLGQPADLSPLVVASVGFLLGSVEGAVVGFGIGLFVDLALVQTLGLSSLVYTVIGYGAGRLRELRDPQGALVSIGVGVGATAAASIGYSIMQIALGVDAPVSFLLLRDLVVELIVNGLLALPVYLIVARWLWPCMPEDPRRRRRRAYTTGGLSPLSRS